MFRNPVDRAYSQYWHLVRPGSAIYDFDRSLQYMKGTILQRGNYKEQANRFLDVFPRENLKFIIFENFIGNMEEKVD